MLSTPSSSNGTPATEPSNRDYHKQNMIISTTTAIVPSNSIGLHQYQLTFTKLNKLSDGSLDSLGVDASETSTSITTPHSMLNPPSCLTTCSKAPPVRAAVHQQQRHYVLQKQASNYRCSNSNELAQRQHVHTSISSAPSTSVTSSLEEPTSSCSTTTKGNGTPLITLKMTRTIPSDKINLRLILVSGKTKEFIFSPSDSAGDIAQTVFENWPADWAQEAVSKSEILRLIYQGRFLHCNVTLGALGLPLGKTTVMHLVPRDNLPEPNSQDQRQKSKSGSGRCCSTTCCIL
ncbi:uncharacterized protein LOC6564907 [Drosophila grimshawi]|uniref:GH12550 n=1 Tax=Drosophila grimshawi TaxID=7222 RepID=B4JJW0_DROGR|nr:uncharacterized protein LOC6564907 [Drosophila grimshawi]EDV99862.1 GH12550 [Drosophila grimshawi]